MDKHLILGKKFNQVNLIIVALRLTDIIMAHGLGPRSNHYSLVTPAYTVA